MMYEELEEKTVKLANVVDSLLAALDIYLYTEQYTNQPPHVIGFAETVHKLRRDLEDTFK